MMKLVKYKEKDFPPAELSFELRAEIAAKRVPKEQKKPKKSTLVISDAYESSEYLEVQHKVRLAPKAAVSAVSVFRANNESKDAPKTSRAPWL